MSTIRRVATLAVFVAAALAAGACASAGRTTAAARPRLTSLTPGSVRVVSGNVTEVDLAGSGFDTNSTAPDNTVRIGPLLLRAVPSSANGTRIRVAIPDAMPSSGEAPPMPWMGGSYAVTVTTRAGTSDTLMLAIAAGGRAP